MTYKEVALAAQLNGAYRCATAALVRTEPRETISRLAPARASSKQRGDSSSRGGRGAEKADTPTKGSGNNGSSAPAPTLSSEGLRCSLWLGRSDGVIEIRSEAVPERLLGLVPPAARAVVTSLLQISRNRVVAALSDGVLRVIDAVSLQERASVQAHKSSITCMVPVTLTNVQRPQEESEFPRISAFVTASSDFTIATWDGVTLGCLCRMRGHSCGVTALAATASGAFLFSGGKDGSLRMWSLLDGAQVVGMSTSHKGTKKATKRKEVSVSLSEHPQQDVKRKKELLLPPQKGGYHTAGQPTAAEVRSVHTRRSVSAQTVSRAAPTRAATPRTGCTSLTPTPRKATTTGAAASHAHLSSPQATAITPRSARAFSAAPATRSAGSRKKSSRAMSATAGDRASRKNPMKSSKSGPTTPRLGVVPHLTEVEVAISVADEEEEEEKNESDEDDKDCLEASGKARQTPRKEDREGALLGKELGSGAAGEGKTARAATKVKKGKKRQAFNFGTVFQQLVGKTGTDPMIQRFLAARRYSGEGDDAVLLWPLKCEHMQSITGLALIGDRILVTASRDGVAKMFALPTGRMLCSVHRSRAALTSLVVDEMQCRLWIGGADGCISIYDALHPEAGQLHGWRDLNTPHPQLVPLVSPGSEGLVYVLATRTETTAVSQPIPTHTSTGDAAQSKPRKASAVKDSAPATSCGSKVPNSTIRSTLACVRLDGADDELMLDASLVQALDRQFESARSFYLGNSLREGVFRSVLRRSVTEEGEELPGYLTEEKTQVVSALEAGSARLLRQRAFSRWWIWRTRRVTRYRRLRVICYLERLQQERMLGTFFRRWQQLSLSKRRSLYPLDIGHVEKRVQGTFLSYSWDGTLDGGNTAQELANALAGAKQRRLLQRHYDNWLRHTREMRRSVVQGTAFNRLFLSFCDAKFGDGSFMWRRLGAAAEATLHHRRALWLLEKRMVPNQYKCLSYYLRRWMQYVQNQKEGRHSLVLVEPLSSVLVDEGALRARFYLKWYQYALFEAKLVRLDEERMTMQREWIAVQNAVDSTASVAELRQEEEHLELEIAQQAFERDGVESQNLALRSELDYLQVQKSLDCLLAGYRDSWDSLRRRRDSGSVPRSRVSSNTSRDRTLPLLDEDACEGELSTLRQVGAVLRALKAAGVRCGRHRALIVASYERVAQLPIFECPLEASDYNSNVSVCSTGGEPSTLRVASTTQVLEGKPLAEQRRSLTTYANAPISLAGEFDRTVQQLQIIIATAARVTGADLSAPLNYDSLLSVPEKHASSDKGLVNPTDRVSLCWLNFVPSTTRTEALPLIVDLVAMFDSFKAHSDTEVEGAGRKLSTRGAPKVMPLPLRSLCKPKSAVWLVRHAAVLLELLSPGLWQRHLRLRALAADTSESLPRANPSRTGTARATEGKPRRTLPRPLHNLPTEELKPPTSRPRSMSWTSAGTCRTNPQMMLPLGGRGSGQRKVFIHSGGSLTPRPQTLSHLSEDDYDGPRLSVPIPLPSPHSGAATPKKSPYGSATTRPYLGFRVAVGRDDTGHTTLTVHEVAESYLCASDGSTREGPAFASGLRAGDQLLRFAGYAVTELAAFNAVVARHVRPWAGIPVHFLRNGQIITATIVVGEKARNG
ncbi:uncharacterized protein Tco025E_01235 [Trypanosoma conorhini]|uniref:Uncharacterized protein n=1 Tax=Trypanosoma conorhini TaxID=83891 RepID=A0A422Q944_9TRYP|nr:uncharacterized protein Tco025E_01235 [Trypanosoma conorhini]RNF26488.1 hypothetical protein Tco025E_01235 [Trypanosoma conorhini]